MIEGVTIQMIEAAELNTVQVSLASYENAKRTTYTLTLVPSVPIKQSNLIMITFPEQIELPDAADLGCSSSFTSLIESLECWYDESYEFSNTVRVALALNSNISQINAMNRFQITLNNIRNPITTKTTDTFEVRVTDKNYVPINSKTENIKVTTNNASPISRASVSQSNP